MDTILFSAKQDDFHFLDQGRMFAWPSFGNWYPGPALGAAGLNPKHFCRTPPWQHPYWPRWMAAVRHQAAVSPHLLLGYFKQTWGQTGGRAVQRQHSTHHYLHRTCQHGKSQARVSAIEQDTGCGWRHSAHPPSVGASWHRAQFDQIAPSLALSVPSKICELHILL